MIRTLDANISYVPATNGFGWWFEELTKASAAMLWWALQRIGLFVCHQASWTRFNFCLPVFSWSHNSPMFLTLHGNFPHVFFPLFVIAACVWHCIWCSLLHCRALSSSVSERRTQRWRGERAFKEISVALKNKMTVSFKALKERGCQICHVEIFCQSRPSNPIERLTNRAAPCTD